MSSTLNPYLNFRGSAREALEFYHSIFGGELALNTFAEFHASEDPAEQDLIMHGQLETASGYIFMGADTPNRMEFSKGVNDFSISLSGDAADEEELTGYFTKLSEGGEVAQPLAAAPWGASFGMLTDKFGISWLVNIAAPAA